MKDGSNTTLAHMKVRRFRDKGRGNLENVKKKFNVLGLTSTLINTNIPMTIHSRSTEHQWSF